MKSNDFSEIEKEIEYLQQNSKVVELQNSQSVEIVNSYFQMNLPGTSAQVFTRKSVKQRLEKVMSYLGSDYKLLIFDIFRTNTTQEFLYQDFKEKITQQHPHWNAEQIKLETDKFVSNPYEKGPFGVCPHNTGGSVDLTLSFQGKIIDMGAPFDDLTEKARTDYYEQDFDPQSNISAEAWNKCRNNRRMFVEAMSKGGFINYCEEWWHFDLGSPLWAKATNSAWCYNSAEAEISQFS